MKNFIKLFGVIVFTAVIVFSFSACKNDSLDGTSWLATFQGTKIVLRFNSPNFTISAGGHTLMEGSYSISDIAVSLSRTASSDSAENAVFDGTLSGNILSLDMGDETIRFTKRHNIFN